VGQGVLDVDRLLLIDQAIFREINAWSGLPLLDLTMSIISAHETWGIFFLIWILVQIYISRQKSIKVLITFGLVVGTSDIVCSQLLKPEFARLRPCHELTNVNIVDGKCGGDWGFPSNHAANSGAILAYIYIKYRSKVAGIAALVALLVSFSRVYLGVHYPLDVLAGMLIGFLIGLTITKAISRVAQ
jgi:undecaprenyl-diphosphatase